MLPFSGRNGFMKYSGSYIPIYSWNLTSVRNTQPYHKSNSANRAFRQSGIYTDTITLRGANFPSFYTAISTDYITYDIGWFDFTENNIKFITVDAFLSRIQITYLYQVSPTPTFFWDATFTGVNSAKTIQETVNMSQFGDTVFCAYPMCNRVITTTDSSLNAGIVQHVTQATIEFTSQREQYAIASSNNRLINTLGVYDVIVNMTIQGDFDYWLSVAQTNSAFRDYKFYYSPTGYLETTSMGVIELNNFLVSPETAEMVSATVKLGASL